MFEANDHDKLRPTLKPNLLRDLQSLQLDLDYRKAEGDYLYYRDIKGQLVPVLDFVGGYGSSLLGHNHPQLTQLAIELLREKIPFSAQTSYRAGSDRLADAIHKCAKAELGQEYRIILSNTGAEAVEVALKHAFLEFERRLTHQEKGIEAVAQRVKCGIREGKYQLSTDFESLADIDRLVEDAKHRCRGAVPRILAVEGSYHGKTLGALSVSSRAKNRENLQHAMLPCHFVRLNDVNHLGELVKCARLAMPGIRICHESKLIYRTLVPSSMIVAMIAEPVQGEGGVIPLEQDFLKEMAFLSRERNIPMIVDEIQSGCGRTGSFFASRGYGIAPDYLTLGKSLGGGMAKVSATLIKSSRYLSSIEYQHSSTFADDDFSSLIALETLRLIECERITDQSEHRGRHLMEQLRVLKSEFPLLMRDVRGQGLMAGIELSRPFCLQRSPIVAGSADQDLLGYAISSYLLHRHSVRVLPCLTNPFALRLEPSAYIAKEAVKQLISGLRECFEIIEDGDAYRLFAHLVGKKSGSKRRAIDSSSGALPTSIYSGVPRSKCHGELVPRVGFVGYFVDAEYMKEWDPSLEPFSGDDLHQMSRQLFPLLEPSRISLSAISVNGRVVELAVYGIPIDSRLFRELLKMKDRELIREKIDSALDIAARDACSIVGFAGYTSIVTANCMSVRRSGLGVTSGNSMTVAVCMARLDAELSRIGKPLSEVEVVVLGAAGNIGSAIARLLDKSVKHLTLVSRGSSSLQVLKSQFGAKASISYSADLSSIRDADVVICATNEWDAIVFPDDIGNQPTIVADLAVPGDVHESVYLLPNVMRLDCGQVDLGPTNHAFQLIGTGLAQRRVYTCALEAIALALIGHQGDYSCGAIELGKVARMRQVLESFGILRLGAGETQRGFVSRWPSESNEVARLD